MKDLLKQTLLYDFYGELLTAHQKQIYEDYVFDDLSLSEIAEQNGISRQGVHDLIKRCDRLLIEYESKLHLVEKFEESKEAIRKMNDLIKEYRVSGDKELIDTIEHVSNEILEKM